MPHLNTFWIAQRTTSLGRTIESDGTGHTLELSVCTTSDEFSESISASD